MAPVAFPPPQNAIVNTRQGVLAYEDYCSRCNENFPDKAALRAHKHFSPIHCICPGCPFDGTTRAEVYAHWGRDGCRKICWGCNDGEGEGFKRVDYDEHVHLFNVCKECHQHFECAEYLHEHQRGHTASNIECHGCDAMFPTYAAMITHLQADLCPMRIPAQELHRTVALVYRWKQLVRTGEKDSRDNFLDEIDLTDRYLYRNGPLQCLFCELEMGDVRDLYEHVKNRACQQVWDSATIERLVNWMENRHYYKIPVSADEYLESAAMDYVNPIFKQEEYC